MGTEHSSFDEWIELFNPSGQSVDLAGWQLQDKTRDIMVRISEGLLLEASEFLLLERSDDTSVPAEMADIIYTGAINDKEEELYLFDKTCKLIDRVAAGPSWPAGTTGQEKRSMERAEDLSWHSYEGQAQHGIYGTPSAPNSRPPKELQNSEEVPPELSAYSKGVVVFSEIAWMGNASSTSYEWIELQSKSTSTTVMLEGWSIEKGDGALLIGEEGDVFGEEHRISPLGFFLLEREEGATDLPARKLYDGSLNNEGETLILRDGQGNEIDRVDMEQGWQGGKNEVAEAGYKPTMAKIENNWRDAQPTPLERNAPLPLQDGQDDPERIGEQETKEEALEEITPKVPNKALDLIISEIAWMGNASSTNAEWIELYNNTTSTIELTGWTLEAEDGSPAIDLEGKIEPQGFFLLERSSDDSLPGMAADLLYSGALNNSGEVLVLKDPQGNEIDSVNAWYAGNNESKETMQRKDVKISGTEPQNWVTSPRSPRELIF